MKFPSRFKHKLKKRSKHSKRNSAEPAGLLQSSAVACGAGLVSAILASVIFSLISLVFGFNAGIVNALGYVAAVICFAVCGYVAGKRGRAAIPSGLLAACGMTLVSVILSFLPLSSGTGLGTLANILIRLGLAAVAVIFAVIGSNK